MSEQNFRPLLACLCKSPRVLHREAPSNKQRASTGNDFPRSKHTCPDAEGMRRRTKERDRFSQLRFTAELYRSAKSSRWNVFAARKREKKKRYYAAHLPASRISNHFAVSGAHSTMTNYRVCQLRVISNSTFGVYGAMCRNNIRSMAYMFVRGESAILLSTFKIHLSFSKCERTCDKRGKLEKELEG